MAEQIKFGDRLFLAGEKVILDNKDNSPVLEARNGELIIGYNKLDVQAKDHHVLIKGDLTVEGTMTSLQTVDTIIKDNIIVLNEGEPGDGVTTIRSGIEVDRGTLDNETFLFSEEGWLGTGGVDPAIDVVLPSWLSSTLSLTDDLSAENIYARNSAIINGELSVTGNAGIEGDTNIGGNANVTGNVEVTGHITASSNLQHQIGDFTFNQNVMSVVSEQMEIRSPGGISFYPDSDNSLPVPQGGEKIVWLRDGTKLVFEGTIPDDYEVKLQATDITADRDIILPDESGTLALQEWVTRELEALTTDDITEGTENLYFTDDRALSVVKSGTTTGFGLKKTELADSVELSIDAITLGTGIPLISGNTTSTEAIVTENIVNTVVGTVYDQQDIDDGMISPYYEEVDPSDVVKDPLNLSLNPFEGNVSNVSTNYSTTSSASIYNTSSSFTGSFPYLQSPDPSIVTTSLGQNESEYNTGAIIALETENNLYSFFKKNDTYGWLTLVSMDIDFISNSVTRISYTFPYNPVINLTDQTLFWLSYTQDDPISTPNFLIVENINTFSFDFNTATASEVVTEQTVIETNDTRIKFKSLKSVDQTINFEEHNGGISVTANIPNIMNNVSSHVLPTEDVTYDLGSPDRQFRSLYLSEQTIYMGGVELRVDGTTNNFSITSVEGDTFVTEAFATETFVTQAITDATSNGSIDLTPYALKTELFSGSYNDLSDTPTIPTNISAFTNDSGYLTQHQDLSSFALKTELFSGSYNDLTNKPTLFSGSYNDLSDVPVLVVSYNDLTDKPSIPQDLSDLTDTSNLLVTDFTGYATTSYVDTQVSNLVDTAPEALNTLNELATALGDDANFSTTITTLIGGKADASTVTNLQNILTAEIGTKATAADLATVATTGSYNDLFNKPTIPTVPNNVSSFTNDAEYLTPYTLITDFGLLTDNNIGGVGSNVDSTIINVSSFNNDAGYLVSSNLSTVAFTGSYNDLTNTPAINVPTNVSELTNDSDYVQTSELETVAFSGLYNDLLLKPALFSGSWNDLTDKPAMFSGSYLELTDKPTLFDGQYSSLVGAPTNISNFINDAGYVTYTATSHIVPNTDNSLDLGNTTNQWRTIYGHTVEATYADLAERYEADAPYDEGTVLVFGGEAEVTACTVDTDVRVAGIVSVNPGLKLNSTAGNSETHPYIALKGRVPCKVIGPVKKGDLLVTSETPGYARSVMGVDMGHAVLGKSLTTDLTGGKKLIEVFVV